MAQQERESLKETLHTQQKLLHQLYAELEAEREASSSAASEALSMILRLQEEKAACQLEACQFKRMTEEKMNHVDEIQQVFEEIMHKKEMEIASLEFQVKAYHYKLLSLGTTEPDIREAEFDTPPPSCPLSRMHSLPALPFKDKQRDVPQITVEELVSPSKADEHLHDFYFQSTSVPKISGVSPPASDLNTHWQRIKELDERVKGLSCATPVYNRPPSSKELRATSDTFPDELHLDLDSSFQLAEIGPMMDNEVSYHRTYSGSSSQVKDIHDVFEVPQNNDNVMYYSPQKRQGKKLVLEEDNRLGKPDPFQNGTNKCCCRDEPVCGKSSLQYSQNENRWTKHKEGPNLNTQFTLVGLTNHNSPVQTDFQQFNERLEKLENETRLVNPEENLRLLKEIREKLDTIHLEITSTKSRNVAAADETSLVSLMEAMFFYSL